MNNLLVKKNLMILGIVLAGVIIGAALTFVNRPEDESLDSGITEYPSSEEVMSQEENKNQESPYKPPYKHYFGEITVIYDSTTREGIPYYPLTSEYVEENANKYLVEVVDVPECSGMSFKRSFIINQFHPSSLYDHGIIYIDRELPDQLQELYDDIPRATECNYISKTAEAQKDLDGFITAYKKEFEEKDLQKIATVLKAINHEHDLVKEMETKESQSGWVNYKNDEYGIEFDYQDNWVAPHIEADEDNYRVNLSFGPVMSWEGDLGLLYNLTIHINKPNVKFGAIGKGCGEEKLFNTLCQTFDPYLEPDKLEQVDLENKEEVVSNFVEEFTVNGLPAYSSKLGDMFTWKHVFVEGLHNGYRFAGGVNDENYDRVVQSFKEDTERQVEWYEDRFSGHMSEETRVCPERLSLDDTPSQSIGFYGGFEVNGCRYDRDKTLEYNYSKLSCADNVEDEIDKYDYNVVNGCLFNKGESIFEENLFTKVIYGDFGEEYLRTRAPEDRKTMGESAVEWFRFEDKGKLYVFLKGAAGCGGCIYNDPYLLINLNTSNVQLKHGDIPYLPNLFLSPDRKKAIEVEFEQINISDTERKFPTQLYLYNFLTLERGELIYEVPEDSTILSMGHGFYPMGISWLDDSTIQVQLFENSNGTAIYIFETENGRNNHVDYVEQGDPVVISVD